LLLAVALIPQIAFAQYKGGTNDGVSLDGSKLQNPLPAIYSGGVDDGLGTVLSIHQNALPGIFSGGSNDGFEAVLSTNQNPLPSIFRGGQDDGLSLGLAFKQNDVPQIFSGGQDDGVASAVVFAQNPIPGIFKGGVDDGFGFGSNSVQNALPGIFTGGQDDGFSVSVSVRQNKSDALPISILSFTGNWFNDDAVLGWEVSDQKNLRHFELERSDDEGKQFSTITTTEPSVSNLYRYTDVRAYDLPPDFLLYRLKCVDNAGGSKFSAIVRLDKDKAAATMVVYPNPTGGKFTLAMMNVSGFSNYEYSLIAGDGKLVKQGSVLSEKTEFNLSGFANGSYHLSVFQKGKLLQHFTIILTQ
ncbi:MAG: T9SS type A sorting domain-containing protein, partial [Chitinophagaceae bacterium]